MLQKLINIGTNSLKRQNLSVMAQKVLIRIKERSAANDSAIATQWASEQAEDIESFTTKLDDILWQETQKTCDRLAQNAQEKLDKLGMDLGGGGHYPLLYFFTRLLNPKIVVETGVAGGWSSQAILTALKENGLNGHLYSSDFPYFRYKNPEQYVGYVVDDNLKESWSLYIDGDQNNLPTITAQIKEPVDLFHYDSDKSVQGRHGAYEKMKPLLSDNAIVIFDDIQDNLHFRDFVMINKLDYKVFGFERKYIGLTGPYFNKG
jgi:predicted O-methyltransferase YrrM